MIFSPHHRSEVGPMLALLSKVFSLNIQPSEVESPDGSTTSTSSLN